MAVLCNNVIAGASIADDAAGGYQIGKSLKFESLENPELYRSFDKDGDRMAMTISFWVKRTALGADKIFMVRPADNDECGVRFDADNLHFYYYDHPNGYTWRIESTAVFRDTTAWYHVVTVFDSRHMLNTDRIRQYVNGVRVTPAGNASYPNQYDLCPISEDDKIHSIGKLNGHNDTAESLDGYIADVQFISGLALDPSAFGSFDAADNWNPKEFSIPAPNDGTTWSNYLFESSSTYDNTATGTSFQSGSERTKGFDGIVDGTMAVANQGSPYASWVYFRPPSAITGIQTLRVRTGYVARARLNGIESITSPGSNGHAGGYWLDFPHSEIPDSLTEIAIQGSAHSGAESNARIAAIEINGVLLQDGHTDVSVRNNPNDGTTWSNGFDNAGGNFLSGHPQNLAWDGKLSTMTRPDQNQTCTWTAPNNIAFSKLEICGHNDNISDGVVVNGVNVSSTIAGGSATQWIDITSLITSPLSTIVIKGDSGTNKASLRGVKIDGHVLVNQCADNSFHLKFTDVANPIQLGHDHLVTDTKTNYASCETSTGQTDPYLAFDGSITTQYNGPNSGGIGRWDFTPIGGVAYTNGLECYLNNRGGSSQYDSTRINKGSWVHWNNDGSASGADNWEWVTLASGSGTLNVFEIRDSVNNSVSGVAEGAFRGLRINGNTILTSRSGNNFAVKNLAVSSGVRVKDASNNIISETFSNDCTGGGSGDNAAANAFSHEQVSNKSWYGSGGATSFEWEPTTHIPYGSTGHNGHIWVKGGDGNGFGFGRSSGCNVTVKINDTTVTTITDYGSDAENNYQKWYKFSIPSNAAFEKIEFTGAYPLVYAFSFTDAVGSGLKQGNTMLEDRGVRLVDGTPFLNGANITNVDTLTDSPTSFGTDGRAGGQVRCNYPTLNSLTETAGAAYSQGALTLNTSGGSDSVMGATMACPKTGKWYWETTINAEGGGNVPRVGACLEHEADNQEPGNSTYSFHYDMVGSKRMNTQSNVDYGGDPGIVIGDVVGVALDADNGAVYFSVNGTWRNSGDPTSGASKTNAAYTWTGGTRAYRPQYSNYGGSSLTLNCGQRPFQTSAPSGYKCLCSANLPDLFSGDALNNPSSAYDTKRWKGDGTTDGSKKIKFSFSPDMVWMKELDEGYDNRLFDRIRGQGSLVTNKTDAQYSDANSSLTTFDSDGISIEQTATESYNKQIDQTKAYIGRAWDTGDATSSTNNASGSNNATIACDYLANPTAGFSVAKYTGTDDGSGTNNVKYVYHGLNAAPDFVIVKGTGAGRSWLVKHKDMASTKNCFLDDTHVETQWGSGYIGDLGGTNANTVVPLNQKDSYDPTNHMADGETYMMYSWTAIPGYSAFGSYESGGNELNHVYLGFTPKFLMIKTIDATEPWIIFDRDIDWFNRGNQKFLYANHHNMVQDNNWYTTDILSNGFKHRNTSGGTNHGTAKTYIYAAFAYQNFKISRAI